MKKQKFLYLVLGAALVTSCVKDKYNFDNAELNYSAKFNLPLINSSIITEDLLKNVDTTLITKGSDNLLKVILSDTIMSIGMDEFVKLSDITLSDNLKLGAISIEDKSFPTTVTLASLNLGLPDGMTLPSGTSLTGLTVPVNSLGTISDFTSLTFSEGKLQISISNNYTFDMNNVVIKLFSNGTDLIGTLTYPSIPKGTSITEEISLVGQTLSNVLTYQITNFDVFCSSNALLTLTDKMDLDIKIVQSEVVKGNAVFPSTEVVNESFDITLASPNGEELEKIILKNASLDFSINYGVGEASKMKITLPYATKGGVAFENEFAIGANSTVVKNFDLSGYTIDLTAGGTTFNTFQAVIVDSIMSSGLPAAFDTANVISYDLKVAGLSVDYVKGYFGQQTVAFTDQTIETGFGSDPLINTFNFADPKISLFFTNSFNLPFAINKAGSAALSVDMIGGPNGNVALTGLTETNIAAGDTVTPVETPLLINKSTTNIVEAFNSKPTQSKVSGSAIINPAGKTVNEAWSNSKLVIVSDIEVPLYGSLNGMEVRDTSDMDLSSLFENLSSVTLRANILNDFPLDGSIDIEFTDENYNTLGYLVGPGGDGVFMSAAAVDANGVGIPATVSKITDFVLDETKVAALVNTKKAIIVVKISSGSNGTTNMKILSTYNMAIKLGIIAKVKIKQSFN